MNRYLFLSIVSLFLLIGQTAMAAELSLDRCNRLYHDAAFAEAITCYEQIGTSAELLFNIGNSYAALEKPGYAVLYYLRALCLAPDDSDIANNLAELRKEHSLFPPEPDLGDQIFNLLSIGGWTYLCLAALAAYLLFLIFNQLKAKSKATEITVTLTCLLLFGVAASGATYHYNHWQRSVVVDDTRLLVSPFANSESTGAIDQGRLVTPLKTYGDYVYITDEMGRNGWLKQQSQVPIIAD